MIGVDNFPFGNRNSQLSRLSEKILAQLGPIRPETTVAVRLCECGILLDDSFPVKRGNFFGLFFQGSYPANCWRVGGRSPPSDIRGPLGFGPMAAAWQPSSSSKTRGKMPSEAKTKRKTWPWLPQPLAPPQQRCTPCRHGEQGPDGSMAGDMAHGEKWMDLFDFYSEF